MCWGGGAPLRISGASGDLELFFLLCSFFLLCVFRFEIGDRGFQELRAVRLALAAIDAVISQAA